MKVVIRNKIYNITKEDVKAMFTTQHAFDILTKLGLKITEKN